ncbi:MAG: OmpH family outer membrane protein [Bacteroidales bacterium]|jgi:outer membrane protein
MKKINIVLFAILFLAVAFLYYMHFSGHKKNGKKALPTEITANGIAFVNIDTVIYKFDMFYDRRQDLMAKQKKAEAELNAKGTQYQKDANDYQDKVNKGLMTRADAAEREKALYQEQQELVSLRDNLQSGLVEEEQVMNRQIIEYITSYLEANKSEYNYQYIIGKSFGSVVLYGDPGLDITRKVLDAINKKYQAEKK